MRRRYGVVQGPAIDIQATTNGLHPYAPEQGSQGFFQVERAVIRVGSCKISAPYKE